MTDITKCYGTDCPLKDKCYRYTAPSDTYQWRFTEVPYDKEKKKCEHYCERGK